MQPAAKGRRPWRGRSLRPRVWAAIVLAPAAVLAVLIAPPAPNGMALSGRRTDSITLSGYAPPAPSELPGGRLFAGTPAVGALFSISRSGKLGAHFCTASVVDSKVRDLAITAAHCVSGLRPGAIAFAPGYHDGRTPYGVWLTSQVLVDSQWASTRDPDHDVAFLVLRPNASAKRVEDVTGGEHLGIGWPMRVWVRVIGYPNSQNRPIACENWTHRPWRPTLPSPYESRQMEFDCGGYTNGTSGGPFLAKLSKTTGLGTVIGVIGGWEEGGLIASVSYSPRFGKAVQALYATAVSRG